MEAIFGKRKRNILTFIGTVIFLVGIAGIFILRERAAAALPKAVNLCNKEDSRLRFSCYRSAVEKNFRGNLGDYLLSIKSRKDLDFSVEEGSAAYAIFGTNCHTFYHALGDFAASHGNDLEELVKYNPAKCTGGYTMGLYKRLALKSDFDSTIMRKMMDICPVNESVQCAHEVGHLLHDKYAVPILTKLDDLTLKSYGIKGPDEAERFSAAGADIKKAFEECDELIEDENLKAQCRTGIGHNLFLFSEFSPRGVAGEMDECRLITDKKTRGECMAFLVYRVGINEAAVKFMEKNFAAGIETCRNIVKISGESDLEKHCYIGLGGGIGLFADSEYALTEINDGNIAGIKAKLNEMMNLCESVPVGFKDNCYAGLFGTRFAKFYDLLKLYNERVEKLRPVWTIFEVVG